MQIYVDLDGVLADFDTGYEAAFGTRPCKVADNVDWAKVRATSGFYQNLPLMEGALSLWSFVLPYQPIVLTGVPSSVAEAPANKIGWVRKHLGSDVEVRCCRSKNKCEHAQPGDILIDDWVKYRDLWIARGGRWITHTSAVSSIVQLQAMGVS